MRKNSRIHTTDPKKIIYGGLDTARKGSCADDLVAQTVDGVERNAGSKNKYFKRRDSKFANFTPDILSKRSKRHIKEPLETIIEVNERDIDGSERWGSERTEGGHTTSNAQILAIPARSSSPLTLHNSDSKGIPSPTFSNNTDQTSTTYTEDSPEFPDGLSWQRVVADNNSRDPLDRWK